MKKNNSRKKVAVGLSGGVDSAVSAYLLKKQGYDVLGIYMWCYSNTTSDCASSQDRNDAIKVAGHLGIPLEIWDFEKEYSEKVLQYFFNEYESGRTPNPDIMCNKEIKFGLFYDKAIKEKGFDFIATGHYARIMFTSLAPGVSLGGGVKGAGYKLTMGRDKSKDQSYFLYRLNKEQLPHIFFPCGNLLKQKVREIAKKAGLFNWNKPDSQGICFVGEVNIEDFIKDKIKYKQGPVLNTNGEVIGEHKGLPFYTIGQRRGFTVNKYTGTPLYVVSKDAKKNVLIVGFKKETEVNEFKIKDVHWISKEGGRRNVKSKKLAVRIRHLGSLAPCTVKKLAGGKYRVSLFKTLRSVASGQSAVFYKNDVVLGGGIICNRNLKNFFKL